MHGSALPFMLLLVGGIIATDCSTDATSSNAACSAGDTRECVGPGACRGAQLCASDAWSRCDCGRPHSGGGPGAGGEGGGVAGMGAATAGGEGGSSPADGSAGAPAVGQPSTGAPGAGGVPEGCVEIEFGARLGSKFEDDRAEYTLAVSPFGEPVDDFATIDFFLTGDYSGGEVGTFDLGAGTDANYRTCSRCVLVAQDSNGTDAPAAVFFQASGSLTATDSGHTTGSPNVTLADVTLVEVTIDRTSFESTPVPAGRCLHLAASTL